MQTKDTNGTYRVSSKPVYVGHPKVLKSKNCKHGNYGMVNSTTLFVREGCGGVFLLPGGAGLMCKSTEGSYVECHTDFQNESVPIEMIEQMSTRDAGNCIERQTYGFANSKEMFVFRYAFTDVQCLFCMRALLIAYICPGDAEVSSK